jgi:hypothetical protein
VASSQLSATDLNSYPSPGRYVSADGLRQVRYGAREVGSAVEHIHFEAYENGFVVENTSVRIVP